MPETFHCPASLMKALELVKKTIIVGYCSLALFHFRVASFGGYRTILSGPAVLDCTEEINVKCDSQSLDHFVFFLIFYKCNHFSGFYS